MFEILKSHLEKIIPNEEIDQLRAIHHVKKVKKGQVLLFEGQVCTQTIYIVKGCLRVYRINDNAEEHVFRFGIENWWINDGESYTTHQPSKSYIDALEDSDLIIFNESDFSGLLESAPVLKAYSNALSIKSFNASTERIYEHMSLSAEERYNNFIKKYPAIYNRIPLHMIASYLGVSKKTLSRIRSKI